MQSKKLSRILLPSILQEEKLKGRNRSLNCLSLLLLKTVSSTVNHNPFRKASWGFTCNLPLYWLLHTLSLGLWVTCKHISHLWHTTIRRKSKRLTRSVLAVGEGDAGGESDWDFLFRVNSLLRVYKEDMVPGDGDRHPTSGFFTQHLRFVPVDNFYRLPPFELIQDDFG